MRNDLKRPIVVAIAVAILLVGAWVISARWDEVVASAAEIGLVRIATAMVLSVGAIIATGECWRRWLQTFTPGLPTYTAHRAFYLTQAGKYLPGAIWPLVGQVTLAHRLGMPRSALVAATTLFMTTHLVTGSALGLLTLGNTTGEPWWILLSLVVGVVALSPPVVERIATFLTRLDTRQSTVPTISAGACATAGSTMLVAWVGFGLAAQILLGPFGIQLGDIGLVLGAFALSWVTGFIAVFAPAGIGAREGAFVALLAPTVGTTPALTVALLSRIVITVGDVSLGAWSAGVVRDESRKTPPPTTG